MSVKAMFEFKFTEAAREEGLRLATAVGNDMVPLVGYLDHEVIQDFSDPGHLMVNTSWATREHANAVLADYKNDPKIKRITELLPDRPGSSATSSRKSRDASRARQDALLGQGGRGDGRGARRRCRGRPALRPQGASVVLGGRDKGKLDELAASCGGTTLAQPGDVSFPSAFI